MPSSWSRINAIEAFARLIERIGRVRKYNAPGPALDDYLRIISLPALKHRWVENDFTPDRVNGPIAFAFGYPVPCVSKAPGIAAWPSPHQ